MVLLMMALGILLLTYALKKGMDNTNSKRTEGQEEDDAALNRKKWRRRAVDWQF